MQKGESAVGVRFYFFILPSAFCLGRIGPDAPLASMLVAESAGGEAGAAGEADFHLGVHTPPSRPEQISIHRWSCGLFEGDGAAALEVFAEGFAEEVRF